jgi:hypothetical protein
VAVLALASVAAVGPAFARPARGTRTTCFWSQEGASRFGIGVDYAFPDSGAVYWAAQITMPPGSHIAFHGRFAHARYQSLDAYDAATHAPVDGLDDVDTAPDRGSVNPYRVGADRDATRRAYTIRMYDTPPPAGRARNALYAGVSGQAGDIVVYRVYVPDSFTRADLTGGVGLPVPSLHLPDGAVRTGAAACAALHAKRGQLPLTTLPRAAYQALREQPGKPRTWPAVRTPIFRAYYNTAFSLQCAYQGQCSGRPARSGGQYSNVDSQYISALVSRAFTAGPVLVLHGKLPTTPEHRPRGAADGARPDALLVDLPERVDLHDDRRRLRVRLTDPARARPSLHDRHQPALAAAHQRDAPLRGRLDPLAVSGRRRRPPRRRLSDRAQHAAVAALSSCGPGHSGPRRRASGARSVRPGRALHDRARVRAPRL